MISRAKLRVVGANCALRAWFRLTAPVRRLEAAIRKVYRWSDGTLQKDGHDYACERGFDVVEYR